VYQIEEVQEKDNLMLTIPELNGQLDISKYANFINATDFNFMGGDYSDIYKGRIRTIQAVKEEARLFNTKILYTGLWKYNKANPIAWINDWLDTYNIPGRSINGQAYVPFLMYPRQQQLVRWLLSQISKNKGGVIPKSRLTGASYVFIALAVHNIIFYDQYAWYFVSNKLENVWDSNNMNALMEKGITMLQRLADLGMWAPWFSRRKCSKEKLIYNPINGSTIKGAGGKSPARGGRCDVALTDETGEIENQVAMDAALSEATKRVFQVGTIPAKTCPFTDKILGTGWDKFFMHWGDNPMYTEEMYRAQCLKYPPSMIARELDINVDIACISCGDFL